MKKKYICISFFGGIGDQIFQFCFANYLKNKFRCDVYVDLSYYKSSLNYNNLKFRLKSITKKKFFIKKNFFKINFKYLSYLRFIKDLKIDNFFFNIKINKFIHEDLKKNNKIKLKNNCFYYGYWHNLKYIKNLKKFLNKNLTKKILKKIDIKKFKNLNINSKSVSLHIRGGDFKWVKSHNTLSKKYYFNSIKFFSKKIKDPTFHIYTDDILFAKKLISNYLDDYNHKYLKNYNFSDLEEFSLLGEYKYSIIANSTFSLLSSFISKNNLITVAPKKWIGNKKLKKEKTFQRMFFL